MEDSGCKILSRADWRSLKTIAILQLDRREGMQIHLQSRLEAVGVNSFMSLQFNLDANKICDRGCQHICDGNWPQIKKVDLSNSFKS